MRLLVIYSSRTGNTRLVAEQALAALPGEAELHPVEQSPEPDTYDAVVIGYWVDRGMPDQKAKDYMRNLKGMRVAAFGTLGANPESEHANDVRRSVMEMLKGNDILGSFLCQGRIDPALLKTMAASPHHPMTPERRANIAEAEKHPDSRDLARARGFFREIRNSITLQEAPCER